MAADVDATGLTKVGIAATVFDARCFDVVAGVVASCAIFLDDNASAEFLVGCGGSGGGDGHGVGRTVLFFYSVENTSCMPGIKNGSSKADNEAQTFKVAATLQI